MTNAERRDSNPQQKAVVVRRHAAGNAPLSQLAETLGIRPNEP